MSQNLGQMADALYSKKGEIAQANARVKELEGEAKAIEERLLNAMEAAGTDIVRGDSATVSISVTIRPQIDDFEAFERFVLRKKALQLFERRVSSTAYQEMKESLRGKPVPGLTEFPHTRLNVRKVS